MLLYFIKGWLRFFDYKGNATRKEFLSFVLLNTLIIILLDNVFFIDKKIITITFTLIYFIPLTALVVRRLHNLKKSGIYIFIILVPFGNLYLIYLLFKKNRKK